MNEHRLNQLFENAKTTPLETSSKDVAGWLTGAVVGLGAAALLPKLKLLIAKKSLIMLSVSTGIIGLGAISMGFIGSGSEEELASSITMPHLENETAQVEMYEAMPVESKLELQPLGSINQEESIVLVDSTRSKRKRKVTKTPPSPPAPPAPPTPPAPKALAPMPTPPPAPPSPDRMEPSARSFNMADASKEISVGEFNKLMIHGIFDVYIKQGSTSSIRVEAENESDIERIEMDNKDGRLTIGSSGSASGKSKKSKKGKKSGCSETCGSNGYGDMALYITVKDLEELKVYGIGDVETESTIEFKKLILEISGVGDVSLDLKGEAIHVQMSAAGDVNLSGEVDRADFMFNGVGDLSAGDLNVNEINVVANGAGDLVVDVNKTLNATVNGVGDIIYSGNPTSVNINENGVGEIIHN